MIRAVIYARVSTPKQATRGYGLGRQREVCEEFADEHGYTVLETVEDVCSGAAYDQPGLWRLRRLVQAGVLDVVLIEAWDRWTRGAEGLDVLENWFNSKGVRIETCDPLELAFDAELKRLLREYASGFGTPGAA